MPASSAGPTGDVLTRAQRLVFGLTILLVVDLIWVASSEFTEYIFHELQFNKPFFSTYFKTSLFCIYLIGFIIHQPWRAQCSQVAEVRTTDARRRYQRINTNSDNSENTTDADDNDDDDIIDRPSGSSSIPRGLPRSLSSPSWIPANIPESGKSSGTESETEAVHSTKRVRFHREAQVVEMNPADALYANLARLSFHASLRAQAALRRAASRLTLREVIQIALLFCVPWFIGNYCYQLALSNTEAAVVNVLSSSSCLFTLILASIFPSEESDRFTLSKLLAICINIIGVVLVSYSDLDLEHGFPYGALWTVVGAFFYAIYIVLLRRKVHHEDNMDSSMFFGFVGLFNALILWPGLPLAHISGIESFELPSLEQWQFLLVNGIVGTVISELLWLWGCFYTSSLVATLAISLTIPLTIIADMVWKKKQYGIIFFTGAVPMFVSFFIVAMLTHYQDYDPVGDLVQVLWHQIKRPFAARSARANSVYVHDDNRDESESLISQESSQEEM